MSKHPEKFKLEALSLIRSCFDINPCLQLRYCLPLLESWSHSLAQLLPPELPWLWVSPSRASTAPGTAPTCPQPRWAEPNPSLFQQWNLSPDFPGECSTKKTTICTQWVLTDFLLSDGKEFPWNMVRGGLLLPAAHTVLQQRLHPHSWTSPTCPQPVHPALLCSPELPPASPEPPQHLLEPLQQSWAPRLTPQRHLRHPERTLRGSRNTGEGPFQGARAAGQGELPHFRGHTKGNPLETETGG